MQIIKLLFFLCLFLLTACLPTMQIEESAIINTRGVDIVEENGIQMIETTIVPYLFDPNATDISIILTGRGNTIKQARVDAGSGSSFRLTPGQIRLELYGKEAAEIGILRYLNTLIRDARVSETMQLAVTDLTAREILESEQEFVSINTSQYLQDLVQKEIDRGSLPDNRLQIFARSVEKVGLDPILPILADGGKRPYLDGAALFRGDRYVARITLQEAFLVNLFFKHVKETPLEIAVPLENYRDEVVQISKDAPVEEDMWIYIYLSLISGHGKIKLTDKDDLSYLANIKMRAELLETSFPMKFKTKEVAHRLEKDIEKDLLKKFEKLFAKLQEANTDAMGLGQIYKATRAGSKMTELEWLEKFPNVTMDFNIDFSIVNLGTSD